MQFPKEQILAMIEKQAGAGHADQASNELPDEVDHEQHADLLSKFGLDPQKLLSEGSKLL